MAMISMILVLLLLAAGLLGVMMVVGLVLLLVGTVNHRKPNYAGRRSPMVCMTLGKVLLALPLLTGVVLTVAGVSTLITTIIKRTTYECVPDRWRNEWWVTDRQAADEVIHALLTSADSGDREAFAKNFTPELQAKEDFDAALDAFFAVYPTGLGQCTLEGGDGAGSASYDGGHTVKENSISYQCTLGNEWYCLTLDYCYRNTDAPKEVGVYRFMVMNLPAQAVYEERLSHGNGYGKSVCLLCDRQSDREVSARLIGGAPFLWTPTDTRKRTADEWRALLTDYHRLDDPALTAAIGVPNAAIHYSNGNLYEYYYELVPENGEPRYAYVMTDTPYGEIQCVYPCTPYEILWEAQIGQEEDD